MITKTEFGFVSHKKEDNSLKMIKKAIKLAETKNKKLFRSNPNTFYVELVYSDKEYDKKTGLKKIKSHRGGYVLKNKIILISPSVKRGEFDLNSFFTHEVNHIFYNSIVGKTSPIWLSEGLATYYMKTYKFDVEVWKRYLKDIHKPEHYLYYRYIKQRHFRDMDKFFVLSCLVCKYLIKKYGSRVLINLIKEFSKKPEKPNFYRLFLECYGLTIKEVVKKAIN
jgi:hypothetical protein